MITLARFTVIVERSRAHDFLNVGFGFRHCPDWMPVFVRLRGAS